MPYLKVIALPHPRKAAKHHQKIIVTNRYVITSIEQSTHTKFRWSTVKNIELFSCFLTALLAIL